MYGQTFQTRASASSIPENSIITSYINDNSNHNVDLNEDIYNSFINQTPEEVVAGLQAKNEIIARNGFATTIESQSNLNGHIEEEVTIETLLQEDPLLSFTTTLDREESNDTILQSSSPLAAPMDPERIVEALTLNDTIRKQSLTLQDLPIPQLNHLESLHRQTPTQTLTNLPQRPIQYHSNETMMTPTIPHDEQLKQIQQMHAQQKLQLQQQLQIQAQEQAQRHAQQQAQQQHVEQLKAQQIQQQQQMKQMKAQHIQRQVQLQQQQQQQQQFTPNTSQFKAQIQNQVMFQHNNNSLTDMNGIVQPQQQSSPMTQFSPSIQQSPSIGFNGGFQEQPSPQFIRQQVLYTPIRNDSPLLPTPNNGVFSPIITHQVQTPLTGSSSTFRQKSRSISNGTKNSPPSPPSGKQKRALKPPMNKSNSTTNLNKVKKTPVNVNTISLSGSPMIGGPVPSSSSKKLLKKSKSFLSTTSVPSSVSSATSKVLYQTLDFSKSHTNFFNSSSNSNQKDSTSSKLKSSSYKNYEFVFENASASTPVSLTKDPIKLKKTSISGVTPRRPSNTSPQSITSNIGTPTNPKLLKFSKPPTIDSTFYTPNSTSPTNSDISSTSPLNSLTFKNHSQPNLTQQTSPTNHYQRVSPESYSSGSSSSNEHPIIMKPTKNKHIMTVKLDDGNVPSIPLESMQSGLIEFHLSDLV